MSRWSRPHRFVLFPLAALLIFAFPGLVGAAAVTAASPFADAGPHPCTRELVVYTGTVHLEANDNQDSMKISAHGETLTGARYVSEQQSVTQYNRGFQKVTILMIRQGETVQPDDFYLHLHFQFGVDADGNPTVTVSKGDPEGTCK